VPRAPVTWLSRRPRIAWGDEQKAREKKAGRVPGRKSPGREKSRAGKVPGEKSPGKSPGREKSRARIVPGKVPGGKKNCKEKRTYGVNEVRQFVGADEFGQDACLK
jgi:hypothetical protein